jgi:hypothetical protein
MNEEIYTLWLEQGKCDSSSIDPSVILYFLKYLDKHSLRLHNFHLDGLSFTNDAQVIQFSYSEINSHVENLKNGIPFPWESFND